MDQLGFGERTQVHGIYDYNVSVNGDVNSIRFESDDTSLRGVSIHKKRGLSASLKHSRRKDESVSICLPQSPYRQS